MKRRIKKGLVLMAVCALMLCGCGKSSSSSSRDTEQAESTAVESKGHNSTREEADVQGADISQAQTHRTEDTQSALELPVYPID
ncbi:hypothetical protein [Ruminococcus sp. FC2018]|uniref:hypothetical protein n=1 Tax=Ruminococcus sp. FC2018 TaxID=1410617 RepID=UPI00048B3AC9|nr:hypothetical protein [Ruminococcus sp. FC2018]